MSSLFPKSSLQIEGLDRTKGISILVYPLRGRLDCSGVQNPNCSYRHDYGPYSLPCDDLECSGSVYSSVSRTGGMEYFSDGSVGSTNYDPGNNWPDNRLLFGKWFPDDISMKKLLIRYDDRIEEVDVDVRLQIPSFSSDPEFERRVIEESARTNIHTNRSSFPGFNEFLFPPKTYPDGQFPEINNQLIDVDVLMRAAIYGIDGVPTEELLNADSLIARVNQVWGIIMAQLYNRGGRQPFEQSFNHSRSILPDGDAVPTYPALFFDVRKYLIQSVVSTRILDGLLSAMVIFGVITIVLLETKEALPKTPCSVSAVASLLYGSRMLQPDIVPRGSEWCSDDELKKRAGFEGRAFTMRWWIDKYIAA